MLQNTQFWITDCSKFTKFSTQQLCWEFNYVCNFKNYRAIITLQFYFVAKTMCKVPVNGMIIFHGGDKSKYMIVKLHVYVRSPFRLNNEYTFCYMMCCMVFFYVLSCRNNVFCYNNFTPSVPSVMLVNHVICLHCLVAIVTNRNYFLWTFWLLFRWVLLTTVYMMK